MVDRFDSRQRLYLHLSRQSLSDPNPDHLTYHVVSVDRVSLVEEILDQQIQNQLLPATLKELQYFWDRFPDLRVNKLVAFGSFRLFPGIGSFNWVPAYPVFLGKDLSWRSGRLWDKSYSYLFVREGIEENHGEF